MLHQYLYRCIDIRRGQLPLEGRMACHRSSTDHWQADSRMIESGGTEAYSANKQSPFASQYRPSNLRSKGAFFCRRSTRLVATGRALAA